MVQNIQEDAGKFYAISIRDLSIPGLWCLWQVGCLETSLLWIQVKDSAHIQTHSSKHTLPQGILVKRVI